MSAIPAELALASDYSALLFWNAAAMLVGHSLPSTAGGLATATVNTKALPSGTHALRMHA